MGQFRRDAREQRQSAERVAARAARLPRPGLPAVSAYPTVLRRVRRARLFVACRGEWASRCRKGRTPLRAFRVAGRPVALRLQHLNILAQHAHPRVFKWSLYIIFKVRRPIRGARLHLPGACVMCPRVLAPSLALLFARSRSIRHTLRALRPSWPCCSPTSLPTLACHLPGMCAQPAPRNAA